jgi:hypothetical protein
VTFDWLDDCLQYKRRLPYKDYLLARVEKKQKRQEEKAKHKEVKKWIPAPQRLLGVVEMPAPPKKVLRVMNEARELQSGRSRLVFLPPSLLIFLMVEAGTHRIYMDGTGFEYEITLTKIDHETNQSHKFIIRLWESKALPPLYAAVGTYNKHGQRNGVVFLSNGPACWFWDAFEAFRAIFKRRTGKDWDKRLDGTVVKDKYDYHLPKLGWPVGLLPDGVKDSREDDDAEISKRQKAENIILTESAKAENDESLEDDEDLEVAAIQEEDSDVALSRMLREAQEQEISN